jgi:hypothetical protein
MLQERQLQDFDLDMGNRFPRPTAQSDAERYGGGSRMQLFSDADSEKSGTSSTNKTNSLHDRTPAESDTSISNPLVTARFKHIVTAEGHAVITGRDGDTLQRCEDEP